MISCSEMKKIFELGRVIENDSLNAYLHTAYKLKLNNYRLISDGELSIRGAGLDVPDFMKEFLRFHGEALMIANIINDKIISITLRSMGPKKEFSKIGISKNMLYGLGRMSKDFKFGQPILLVEGHLDRDVISELYSNSLALTTNMINKSQAEILKRLTNKFILMLDNDEAGRKGTQNAYNILKGCKIKSIHHENGMKDCGDLVKLELSNINEYEWVKQIYKSKIEMELY